MYSITKIFDYKFSKLCLRANVQKILCQNYGTKSLATIRPDLDNYAPASNLALNEKMRKMMKKGDKVYHFAFGQSPFPVLPELEDSLKEFVHVNDYLAVAGEPDLLEALTAFHHHYDQFTWTKPHQYIVGPGSKQLIFLTLLVFSGEVYLPGPSWTTYKPQCVLAGHSNPNIISTSFENGWKITAEMLDDALTNKGKPGVGKLLIINNPDNPTGASYTAEEFSKLSVVLRRHRCIVISDEIYARLHYEQQHVSLAHFYPEGTIVSTGLSKWASAGGWRIGYHIYPAELLSTLYKYVHSAASHSHSCCPAPMQHALAHTLTAHRRECHRYMQLTTRILAAVARYAHSELCSVGIECQPAHAGYYIFPNFDLIKRGRAGKVDANWTGQQFVDDLFQQSHVAVMSGHTFLQSPHEWSGRLCYVNFDGSAALQYMYNRPGLDTQPIADSFLEEYCSPVLHGIQAIKQYVTDRL